MSIPIPEGFPAPTVDLQIALAGVSIQAPEQLTTLTERFYSIFWAEGNTKITNQEVFQPILQHELPDNGVSDLVSQILIPFSSHVSKSQDKSKNTNLLLAYF